MPVKSLKQRTLRSPTSLMGRGLHSGKQVEVRLLPAPEGAGIVFVRADLEKRPTVAASWENVVDTALATTLGRGGVTVATVEHLMAAFSGLGIDNCRVEVQGPELPILDGSAAPFVTQILQAGIKEQELPKKFLVIRRPVRVQDGDKWAELRPARDFRVDCTIDFKHPLISDQTSALTFEDEGSFVRDIARARTFGFRKDVEALQRMGLALGGSLENAIVVDEFSILNSGGLRFPNEFARHKLLDAIGDVALLGMPILGRLEVFKSGHALNHKLVQALMAHEANYAVVRARSKDVARWDLRLNDLEGFLSPVGAC